MSLKVLTKTEVLGELMAQLALGSLSVMQKSLFKRAELSVFVG